MAFSSDTPLVSNQSSQTIEVPPPDSAEFRSYMTQYLKRASDSMNTKEGALYLLEELATFQQWFKLEQPFSFRNGYRTTFDLVDLWGAPIPNGGMTSIPIESTDSIDGIVTPTNGFGAAVIVGPIYYFINDPLVYVRFNNTVPLAQVIEITNNTGSPLEQCIWCFEYLKEKG